MKYYLLPYLLAVRLGITDFRHGNSAIGYIATSGDLAAVGVESALAEGARELTEAEAMNIMNKLKNH